ncbi:hypothetical protein OH76DRAFT_370915 [Lentinus brumalis]|uniref:Uncharacterized protein n=1 Tax=Lentinus brumalis TaxID=2498619 RepID=A0A371DEE4_9APHY|nr:hypothetical protein OH76DRAFT_370915 [Polyporus brumalis]
MEPSWLLWPGTRSRGVAFMSKVQGPSARDAAPPSWRCRCRWRYQIEMVMSMAMGPAQPGGARSKPDIGRHHAAVQGAKTEEQNSGRCACTRIRTREGVPGQHPTTRGSGEGRRDVRRAKELLGCWIWRGRAYRGTGISMMVARPGRGWEEAKSHVWGSGKGQQEGRRWLREGRLKEYVVPAGRERKPLRTSCTAGKRGMLQRGCPGARSEHPGLPERAQTLSQRRAWVFQTQHTCNVTILSDNTRRRLPSSSSIPCGGAVFGVQACSCAQLPGRGRLPRALIARQVRGGRRGGRQA